MVGFFPSSLSFRPCSLNGQARSGDPLDIYHTRFVYQTGTARLGDPLDTYHTVFMFSKQVQVHLGGLPGIKTESDGIPSHSKEVINKRPAGSAWTS